MRSLSNSRVKAVGSAAALTFLLLFTIKTESLWTDEAFSAFIACHRTYSSLWQTLRAGDSSDLQVWLYYVYLHFWVTLFGYGEFALRAANIPFVFVYAGTIFWMRSRLFLSDWVWVAALSPFAWAYAGDARPYMTIVTLSTVVVTCLIAAMTDPRHANSRTLPWLCLVCLLIGLNLHMLMVLLIPPGIVFVLAYSRLSGAVPNRKPWLQPLAFLSPVFAVYFAFLAWTFERGTSYDYARPDVLSMGSVLFRFLGLAGFAPNRHYDVSFRPYLFGMASAAVCLLSAGAFVVWPAVRHRDARTVSLLAALAAGVGEALVLSFVFKQQIEVRHLACLFALVLFLLFAGAEFQQRGRRGSAAVVAFGLVAMVWLLSDARLAFLPEYKREDFRGAVTRAIYLAETAPAPGAEIAIVADPAAAAYYGVALEGASPCFPLAAGCEAALAEMPWRRRASGVEATFWTPLQISQWLKESAGSGKAKVLLISRSRHPIYLDSRWWRELSHTKTNPPERFHGFFVYSFIPTEY